MPVKDIRSGLRQNIVHNAAITTDTTTSGEILDTANNELGLMFALFASAWTDGTYVLLIQESDDSGMSGATTVSGDQLIGSLPSVAAAIVAGAAIGTVGVIGTKRYIRAQIVSTSTSSGATIQVIATQKAEEQPVA